MKFINLIIVVYLNFVQFYETCKKDEINKFNKAIL